MNSRFLEYYNLELQHLRESAADFAREYPKIAGRLNLDRDGKEICPDPFVERLLEGFAFLAARVHYKLDAEFPRFTQALLETVYPHYLAPVPAMAIIRFEPDNQEQFPAGFHVKRGTLLRSLLGKGETTSCTFQTCYGLDLFPLRLVEARYFTQDVSELDLPPHLRAKAALRLRLQTTGGTPLKQLQMDQLRIHIRGSDDLPDLIFEQLFRWGSGVVLQSGRDRLRHLATLGPEAIQRVGLKEEEAVLPAGPRTFEGYRLLREYFTFPQKFLFFQIQQLLPAIREARTDELDIIIPFQRVETRLERVVDAGFFDLFCVPAINLFPKTVDNIQLLDRFSEFHVVPDRTRPLDFEIYEIQKVTGVGEQAGDELEFRPFYWTRAGQQSGFAYYAVHRVQRTLTAKEKQFGRKSEYLGSDMYLSLVDAESRALRSRLEDPLRALTKLSIQALCTNRHLPIQMSVGVGRTDFDLLGGPINAIRCIAGPTAPRPSAAEGEFSWKLISHLSLNYLSLLDLENDGAAALREILRLYVTGLNSQVQKEVDGIRSVQASPVVRRVQVPGPIAFARGLELQVVFDESAYQGVGVFLLGSVLEQFFAKYVSMNSFTETVIQTQQRGELIRWPAQLGRRPLL